MFLNVCADECSLIVSGSDSDISDSDVSRLRTVPMMTDRTDARSLKVLFFFFGKKSQSK